MKKIILASASPRRKAIFEKLNINFEIIPSSYEESMPNHIFSYDKIENLAYNKALSVAKKIKEPALVVGADTVVVLDNNILCKPKDKTDAFYMLKSLSNRKHFVVTAICVIDTTTMRKKVSSTTSYVEFENLTDEMINNYIDTFNPLDKAGAYGIQELPSGFLKSVNGSFENIIGLCPKALQKILKTFKVEI
ncbi:MAG: nucleoside triphosphate pyrophosphatase [Candidatus Gastranaerophilaceae bacterium]